MLAEASAPVEMAPHGRTEVVVPADVRTAGDAGSEVLSAELEGVRGVWFFAEGRDSALSAPELTIDAAAHQDGLDVTITARTLVRDLTLLVDKIRPEAVADEGLVTLLPGESVTIRVAGLTEQDAARLDEAGIVCTANELVAR